jgi:hypothetical protein
MSGTEPRVNQDSLETGEAFSSRIPKDETANASLQDPGHSKVRTQPASESIPEGTTRVVPQGESLPSDAAVIDPVKGAAQRTADSSIGAVSGGHSAEATLSGATSGDFNGSIGAPVSGMSSHDAHHLGQGTTDDQKSHLVNQTAEDHDHPPAKKTQGFRGDA